MDLSSLAPSVQKYFQDGLAPSTQKTYAAALRRFHAFCLKFNVSSPFPVSEHLLCCFASFLADQGLAPQTGKGYLSAIRSMQISLGLPDPREQSSLPLLKRVQAGISRAQVKKGTPVRIRLPITAHVLEQMGRKFRNSANPHKVSLWAIACTAFFGFFRLGELLPESPNGADPATSLVWGDVAVNNRENPTMVCIHLKISKCDQFGRGADIILGRTSNTLCPVAAILQYIATRGSVPGPFFLDAEGRTITKPWFIGQIREVLGSIGLPQHQYAGHSFRIGAATTAALAGVEDSVIQALGRWQSAAFLQYIRMPPEQLATFSAVLASATNPASSQNPPQQ